MTVRPQLMIGYEQTIFNVTLQVSHLLGLVSSIHVELGDS